MSTIKSALTTLWQNKTLTPWKALASSPEQKLTRDILKGRKDVDTVISEVVEKNGPDARAVNKSLVIVAAKLRGKGEAAASNEVLSKLQAYAAQGPDLEKSYRDLKDGLNDAASHYQARQSAVSLLGGAARAGRRLEAVREFEAAVLSPLQQKPAGAVAAIDGEGAAKPGAAILRCGDYSDVSDCIKRGNDLGEEGDAKGALALYAEVIGVAHDFGTVEEYLKAVGAVWLNENLDTKHVKNIGEALVETTNQLKELEPPDMQRAKAILEFLSEHPSRLFRLTRIAIPFNRACIHALMDTDKAPALNLLIDSVRTSVQQMESKEAQGKVSPSTLEDMTGTVPLINRPGDLASVCAAYFEKTTHVANVLTDAVGNGFSKKQCAAYYQRLEELRPAVS